MFKTLTRTLKLGLTTFAILTAGGFAGTAFAQTYADDRVGYCANNPSSSLCPRQVDNCIAYPFGTSTYSYGSGGCAGTFTAQELIVARVRYCSKSANRSKSVCGTTVANPNAANWAKQNPDAVTTPTAGVSRFLKGTADGVDTGSFSVDGDHHGALNLNTATFNGRALGGDATDGVAFFKGEGSTFYTGILSGTDLGAPVTQTSGTANWVGQFQSVWHSTNQDFVLEVTFGGTGGVAGSIEAFVHKQSGDRYYGIASHFHLKGTFDDSGLITGTVDAGNFTDNDRDNPTGSNRRPGVLTGLIGQEGAVGAFHSNGSTYAGGFVARPAWGVTSATWLQSFTQELPSAPSTTSRRNQFLKGTASGINRGDVVVGGSWANKTLNLNTATFNGRALGGDASDGVTAIGGRVHSLGTWYWYAGIFSGTDLGAPVTQTSGTANWVGSFQVANYSVGTDFVLEVNFANKSVAAFVQRPRSSNVSHFYLNGNYDDSGVIIGTVVAGDFTNNNREDTTGTRRSGILRGLIGQEGAIGAFISNQTGSFGYSGGFVARPANAGVTSATWLQSFTEELPSAPSTTNPRNQFLRGTANGVDKGDIVVNRYEGSLNLNTATFNGTSLGGDAADGVAYFRGQVNGAGALYYYSGIFSGTDLGAPITETTGTASWVGKFQSIYHNETADFVLEVDYTNKSVDAFVHWYLDYHFYLDGNYDDNGVITGDFNLSRFNNKNRNSKISTYYAGVVTGLIGQEGAVGAFHSNSNAYAGGFVARPANNSEKAFLNRTCTADPSHKFCYLTATVSTALIADCIIGSNASASRCSVAISQNPCITNPFASNCVSDFADHYVTARTNRINFCTSNPTNSFCRNSSAISAICTYAPFASICFSGNTYKSTRAGKIGFCHTNTTDLSCTGVTDNPNAVAWADSFATALADTPAPPTDGTTRRNQFLKGTASGVNRGDIVAILPGSLNLNTATFNGRALGGDAADGAAFFLGRVNGQGTAWYSYAGIFSGTDLGAPVTQSSGTASWVGRFRTANFSTNEDFVLEVNFNGSGDEAGYIEAFVKQGSGAYHFHLNGSYDAHGVITGTVDRKAFTNRDRDRDYSTPYNYSGILTGLIGQEGAVGAFYSSNYNYSGGFVARPANTADNRYLNTTCTNDPFGPLCYLEKGKQRDKITQCIEGSNASGAGCASAVQFNTCLTNPFASDCVTDFADHYITARTKRAEFCVGNLTNSLCTGTDAISGICTYAPFLSICFNGNTYKSARAGKIGFCHTNTTHLSCTGVRDNPNAVAWVNSFTTALSSVPSTTNRRNQFLKGTTSGVNSGDIAVYAGAWANKTLNLSTATFRGTSLRGDASDGGVSIAGRVNNTGTWYWYAGIFSGTDLGAPVTQRSGKASWVGKFEAINYGIHEDFVLEVNFATRTVDAFVQRGVGNQFFHIDGNYDSKGIITGTVNFGTFLHNDRSSPTGTNNAGTLAGLIGQEGAVGAFISNQTGGGGYAGGFVARPANSSERTFLTTTCAADPYHKFCYLTPVNRFLPGTRTGLVRGDLTIRSERPLTVLTLGDNLKSGVPLGGSRNSGVAFFGNKTGSKLLYFAGILSGTDLGRTLASTNVAMEWNGRIRAHNNTIDKDFKLKITFNGSSSHIGEVEAFVQRASSSYYHLKGNFDSSGVITGTVDLGNFTSGNKSRPTGTRYGGELRGLIGAEGAIGAFIAKNNGDQGYYSGGFVASPNAIRYASYNFGSPLNVTTYPRGHGIIRSPYVKTVTDFSSLTVMQLNRDATRNYIAAEIVNLNLSIPFAGKRGTGDSNDGVYFFRGSPCSYGETGYQGQFSSCTATTTTQSYFAAVNPNTNLGPVLDQTSGSAIWHGKFMSYFATDGVVFRDFNLNVNYGTQRISASVSFPHNDSAYTYNINGTYDNHGVIRGGVNIAGAVTPNTGLVGLIGQHGAVGAFVSTHSSAPTLDFAGGFVAQAPAR